MKRWIYSVILLVLLVSNIYAADIYNIVDYGAKIDDKTIDSVTVQKAIDAAVADGGEIVFFPRGICLVDRHILMNNYITLQGFNSTIVRLKRGRKWRQE